MKDIENKIKNNFEVMTFFDTARWAGSKTKNPYELNIFEGVEEQIEKEFEILVHWITYISERGSDFRPIWDKGAYVYSRFLKDYFERKKSAFDIIKIENGEYIKKIIDNNKEAYVWYAKDNKDNKKLKKYDITDNEVKYRSRYYTADYVSIALTLSSLEKHNRSIITYIMNVVEIIDNHITNLPCENIEELYVKGIAMALYCLTYDDLIFDINNIKNYKFNGISKSTGINDTVERFENDCRSIVDRCKKHSENLESIISKDCFWIAFDRFYDGNKEKRINGLHHQLSNMKRVWCSVRDYLKNNYFKECFITVFNDCTNKPETEKMLCYLELPGDVWNNNSRFSKCLFSNIWDKEPIKKDYKKAYNKHNENFELKKLLRLLYDNRDNSVYPSLEESCYPEIFDCTFDFVPRMCDSNNDNCTFCPFSSDVTADELKKYCVCNKNKKCSIAKICCGYDYPCDPDKCKLKQIMDNL